MRRELLRRWQFRNFGDGFEVGLAAAEIDFSDVLPPRQMSIEHLPSVTNGDTWNTSILIVDDLHHRHGPRARVQSRYGGDIHHGLH